MDMLEVVRSGFQFYEIGCELKDPSPTRDGVRFIAQCWKGGSPDSRGTVVMRLPAPDRVEIVLQGFSWNSERPETFRRCDAD